MRELSAYLSEFEAGAGNGPVRFGAAAPSSSSAPSTSSSVPVEPARLFVRVAEAEAPSVSWPSLGVGSGGSRPIYVVPAAPTTTAGWAAAMREARNAAEALFAAARAIEAAGRDEVQGSEYTAQGIRLAPSYSIKKLPTPRSGCDISALVWTELFVKAQGVLLRLATPPPTGVPGVDVVAWSNTIYKTRDLLFRASNLRRDFFFMSANGWRTETAPHPKARKILNDGLVTDAQSRGIYVYDPRADRLPSFLTAMSYAPVPRGGFSELMGRDLSQDWEFEVTFGTSARDARYGTTEVTGGLLPRTASIDAPAPAAPRSTGRFEVTSNVLDADMARVVDAYWAVVSAGALGTGPGTVYHANANGLQAASRRFSIGSTNYSEVTKVSVGHWIANAVAQARFFGDGRFSLGEISLRTVGFYLNSYLDFAARFGLVPRADLTAAQGEGTRLRAAARANLDTAFTVTQIVLGTVNAVLAAIPVVGWIAGAVVAIVQGLIAILQATGSAASAGTFFSPVLPLYQRFFAGVCEESSWIVSAPPEVAASPAPGTGAPLPTTPDEPPAESSGGVAVVGALGLGLGLWLLLGSAKR